MIAPGSLIFVLLQKPNFAASVVHVTAVILERKNRGKLKVLHRAYSLHFVILLDN